MKLVDTSLEPRNRDGRFGDPSPRFRVSASSSIVDVPNRWYAGTFGDHVERVIEARVTTAPPVRVVSPRRSGENILMCSRQDCRRFRGDPEMTAGPRLESGPGWMRRGMPRGPSTVLRTAERSRSPRRQSIETRVYGALIGTARPSTVTVWVVTRSIEARPASSGMVAVHTLPWPDMTVQWSRPSGNSS